MLELAITANLPLIKVETDDLVNFPEVLATIADEDVYEITEADVFTLNSNKVWTGKVHYVISPENLDYSKAYKLCVENDKILVVVNPLEGDSAMFDAGVIKLPKQMLEEFLYEILDEQEVDHLTPALGGLSLKDVAEVCRLCMAQHQSLTSQDVVAIRRMYMTKLNGVKQVNTDYGFYEPNGKLEKWTQLSGKIFKRNDLPQELIPRGILMNGEPGAGKTMGAKYLANALEIPLFRLDLGGLMAKWVGESEGNMNMALAMVDQAEPCILLIDEVEKLFKSTDDSGVTSRMLSQLLWWLQEHDSRVLTVMTTNDKDALPDELYRPGRIDRVIEVKGLSQLHALVFAKQLLKSMNAKVKLTKPEKVEEGVKDTIKHTFTKHASDHSPQYTLTPDRITQIVYGHIRRFLSK